MGTSEPLPQRPYVQVTETASTGVPAETHSKGSGKDAATHSSGGSPLEGNIALEGSPLAGNNQPSGGLSPCGEHPHTNKRCREWVTHGIIVVILSCCMDASTLLYT